MLEHRRDQRSRAPTPSIPTNPTRRTVHAPSASSAAQKQKSGLSRLSSLFQEITEAATPTPSRPPSTQGSPVPETTEAEREAEKQRLDAEDERIVDDEICRYCAAGVIRDGSPEMEDFDILRYWQVRGSAIYLILDGANCLRNNRLTSTISLPYSAPPSISSQSKHQPYPANEFSHLARRQTHCDVQTSHLS
jgi:hypothetical protein